MKVWVLEIREKPYLLNPDSDFEIEDIFSTEEKAESVGHKMKEDGLIDDYFVISWSVKE
jgi:hypothetical protein